MCGKNSALTVLALSPARFRAAGTAYEVTPAKERVKKSKLQASGRFAARERRRGALRCVFPPAERPQLPFLVVNIEAWYPVHQGRGGSISTCHFDNFPVAYPSAADLICAALFSCGKSPLSSLHFPRVVCYRLFETVELVHVFQHFNRLLSDATLVLREARQSNF